MVVPASLINQWKYEIESKFTANAFKVLIYHGKERSSLCKLSNTKETLEKADIVITSYNIATMESDKVDKKTNMLILSSSPLAKISWRRIICDEAHIIKNDFTQGNKALCSYSSEFRFSFKFFFQKLKPFIYFVNF